MSTARFRYAFTAALVVVGLSSATGAATPAAPIEVRAFVNDTCIVADEPFYRPDEGQSMTASRSFTLLGMVVGKLAETLITQAVRATADRVGERGKRKDTRYAIAHEANLYAARLKPTPELKLNGQLGCMTIVAGQFEPDDVQCRDAYQPRTLDRTTVSLPQAQWKSSRTDDSLANPLRRANVCMKGAPRAVYEARFEFSPDGTAYRLRNAGFRLDELLTTSRRNAARNVFYTLEISQPSVGRQAEVLSTAMVDLGRQSPGAATEPPEGNSPWLRVPALSPEARRTYEQQTRVHQEVAAEIGALERAVVRTRRLVTELESRKQGATAAVVKGLKAEQEKAQVQALKLDAELETRRREYAELPDRTLELMPVSIEIRVTESTSEKPAVVALGKVMEGSAGTIGAATVGYIVARSIDPQESAAPAAAPTPPVEIELARAAYHDARVEARSLPPEEAGPAQQRLDAARQRYDAARSRLGLDAVN